MSEEKTGDRLRGTPDARQPEDGRRGPAQPRRANWRETMEQAERVVDPDASTEDVSSEWNAGSPASERRGDGENSEDDRAASDRRHGPAPSRRRGSVREMQPAPADEPGDDSERAGASILSRPSLITGAVLTVIALLILLTALFVFAQAVTLYNEIAALPGWMQPIGYAILALLGAGILYFGGRIVWLYLRLRVSPRLSLAAEDLERRDRAHAAIRDQRLSEARSTLTEFLDAYGMSSGDKQALRRVGASEGQINDLESMRHVLIARHSISDDAAWLARFQSEFLLPLDDLARRHTRMLIKQVFVGTSMAPRGALDTLVVLVLCYRLIADLCVIYRVRAGRWETAIMLGHIMVNLLTASQADEIGGEIGSRAGELLDTSFDALPGIISSFAAEFVGRGAEGGVNALLLWRLSVRAQSYLRPVRKRPEPAANPT